MNETLHARLAPGQNFGAMTRTVATADLVVNAADHSPRAIVPAHEHANAYLCILFAGAFELQTKRRVERADRALQDRSRSLADIAIAAGFTDQAHFTRVYRRHFGVSPGARRRAMQLSS